MTTQSNPRKIIQVGSSLGVTVPSDVLDEVGLSKGDRVVLEATADEITMEQVEIRRSDP